MHKEKWVYQTRLLAPDEYPWALLIDVDYVANNRAETMELAFTLYSENIQNSTHSIYIEGGHKRPTEYVSLVVGHLGDYSTVYEEDINHLTNAILDAMIH